MRLALIGRLRARSRADAETPAAPDAIVTPPLEVPSWKIADDLCIVRMRDGTLICSDPRDASLGVPIRSTGEWEPHVAKVLQRLLRPGDRVVDIGSNIGCHVAPMARAIGASGSLLAIEANPDVADLLRGTVALNRLRNVRIVQAIVLDRPGEAELFVHDRDLGGGAVGLPEWEAMPALRQHRRHRVAAVTLDELAGDLAGVELLHMDVEGCELAILAGAERLLWRSPEVKIVCEWGAHHAPAYFGIEAGLDLLQARGFSFWRITGDGGLTRQSRQDMLKREFGDVVMARGSLV